MGKSGLVGTVMDGLFGSAPEISAPERRDYLSEMRGSLNAQGNIQNQLLGLEGQYTPQYQALQQAGISGGIQSLANLYGQAGVASNDLQNSYLGMQSSLYGQLGKSAMGAYQQSLDPSTRGLYASMMASAQGGLDAGRSLTPEMERLSQQSARAAMASRGMQFGNQAIAAEVLNSYNLGNQREDRARAYAGNMYNAGIGQTQSAMSTYGQPLMSQMASYSPSALVSGGQSLYGGLGAKLFQPESQYNAAIIGSNISNTMQTNLANAQIQAAHQAAQMGMVGSVLGGVGQGVGQAGGWSKFIA